MIKAAVTVTGYTLLNVRYSALILPCGVVAYLLGFYWLAVVAGVLLLLAAGAEVALSIANGLEAHRQIQVQRQMQAEDEALVASFMTDIEKHANDWTHRGSEDPAPEGEDPDEGEAPVSSR